MKALIIIVGLLITFNFSACDQEKVPEKVTAAFHQKYPAAEDVDWDVEGEGEWEAEFELGGKEMSANFDNNGKWLETETEIEEGDLPPAVKETLKTQFKGYQVEEAEYLESPEYAGYELELEGDKEDIEVLIGKNGKILKQETEEENEDTE